LLVFNVLQHERRTDAPTIGRLTQRGEAYARSVLEGLVERGLLEGRGERRARIYLLSAALYGRVGTPAGYVRARGSDTIQREAMVLQYVQTYGQITRREGSDLCRVDGNTASNLLRKLARLGSLIRRGEGKGAYYILPEG
jgi:ATP-dependent DNA helicase RecG